MIIFLIINNNISILQLMVIAFPDPSAKKNMLIAGSNILMGAASSVTKMSLDPRLVTGLISSATIGMQMLRRTAAQSIVTRFNMFRALLRFTQENFSFSCTTTNCTEMNSKIFLPL